MNTPTKTTNKLHFEDLDPHRFEDLGAELLYRKQDWKRFNNWGRSGSDDGIDIFCEDGNGVKWYCQCKRYTDISTAEIKAAVDKIVSKNENTKDGIILLVVACTASKKSIVEFEEYSKSKGFKDAFIWFASTLEFMLFKDHDDLLSKYFSITPNNTKNKEKVLRSNKMKQEVQKKLLRKIDWNYNTRMQIAKNPSLLFRYDKALIRSINDVDDPYGDDASYCQICFFQLTEVGIEFFDRYWINFRIAINTNTRFWRILDKNDILNENEFDIRADHTVLIPYYSIVDILEDGDEHSEYPIIICDFEFNNTPFLRHYYKNRETKSDFIEGKPVEISSFALLLEEYQKRTIK